MANHEAEWKGVLDNFFSDFTQQLDKAEKDPEEGGMRPNQMVLTSIDCPTCGRRWVFVPPTPAFSLVAPATHFPERALQNHH